MILDCRGLPKFARTKCVKCGSILRRVFYRTVEYPYKRVNIPGYIYIVISVKN